MSIGRIATRVVATATPHESVLDVARRMREHDVGAIVVVDDVSTPVGIVTDRDIVLRGVARALRLDETPASAVMTSPVQRVDESLPIERALATMSSAGARRLVVTGSEGRLVGLASMDDVIELLVEEIESIGELVRKSAPSLSGSS